MLSRLVLIGFKTLIDFLISFDCFQGEVDSRLMSALLMGVKRSFPYAKLEHGGGEVLTKHINTLYKIVHISNFNIALHTLCLLQQVSSTMEDRY
jgi:ribosome biogenesis protein MAK21